MKTEVRYYTRTGNTKKLADAIAEAIGLTAESIDKNLQEKVDVLFLGCSYYAFDLDPEVKKFVEDNKDKIGKIVCFGTSAMLKSMHKPLKKVTDAAGVALAKEEFHCWGSFGKLHKDRPNASDLADAKAFAKSIIGA